MLGSECPDELGVCVRADASVSPSGKPDAGAGDASPPAVDATEPVCGEDSEDLTCGCEAEPLLALLAHWPLDEGEGRSALDVTGHAPSGTLMSFVGDAAWQTGKLGSALQFDGIDDHVRVGAVPGTAKTLSLWLAPDGTHVRSERTTLQLPTSHGPLDQWTDAQNAYADDNQVASASSLIGLRDQHWGGFHLAEQLPRDAQILGITVTIDTGNVGILGAFRVELSWDGGQSHTDSRYAWGQLIIGSNQSQAGGTDKLWGRTWRPEDFNAENFRVRGSFGGIANAMALDYLGVQITYAQYDMPRTILTFAPNQVLTFGAGETIANMGDAAVYVNGAQDGTLASGWNHVALVSTTGFDASALDLGMAPAAEELRLPYQGRVDDVRLFEQALTPFQLRQLHELSCEP